MELVIVRHGETEWTITGRFTGTTEVPLTADGRRQVVSLHRILSGVLKGRSPVVLSSPRVRARETAGLALPDSHALVDPLLAEFDYGTYEGLTPTEVADRRPGWPPRWSTKTASRYAVARATWSVPRHRPP